MESIASGSIDLIYLDPPFNSKRDYNLLFKTPKGHSSEAQITAFEDSWHWGAQAELEFSQILNGSNVQVSEMMRSLRIFLGENDMMAYLTIMANRLLELHRVLKPTGSLYLHCDPTASHYIKIILDGIFGHSNFRNEIIWKRSNPKSHGSVNFPTCSDTIFRYSKSNLCTFHQPYESHDPDYIAKAYRFRDEKGQFRLLPLLNPSDNRPNLTYEFLGVTRVWRWTRERMEKALTDGLIVQTKPNAVPQYKKYLSDSKGRTITNVWTDIQQASEKESLGYPTQKPLALLERIIQASSNEGDIILDPFCGCGTAVHAAQKLNRKWIGIDITHLAISLIEKRLRDAFPDIEYKVEGTPKDFAGAENLSGRNPFQFEWWALSLIHAQPVNNKKKGSDGGIDGVLYFVDDNTGPKKIVVSVKGGNRVGVAMIRDFAHVVHRERAAIGAFITLTPPTGPMKDEAIKEGFYDAERFPHRTFPKIQILTIEGLLNKQERLEYPDLTLGNLNFKQAKREGKKNNQERLL